MTTNRFTSFAAAASAATLMLAAPAPAAELVFGSWTPAQEYQNRVAMPELIKNIDKDTNGAIKWKLIAGGQIADGKTTFTAVKDGLMQAGLGIVTYVTLIAVSLLLLAFSDSRPIRDLRGGVNFALAPVQEALSGATRSVGSICPTPRRAAC
jgi:TRAP-type C4-dicarboxylate transport system substrate-binding protein